GSLPDLLGREALGDRPAALAHRKPLGTVEGARHPPRNPLAGACERDAHAPLAQAGAGDALGAGDPGLGRGKADAGRGLVGGGGVVGHRCALIGGAGVVASGADQQERRRPDDGGAEGVPAWWRDRVGHGPVVRLSEVPWSRNSFAKPARCSSASCSSEIVGSTGPGRSIVVLLLPSQLYWSR